MTTELLTKGVIEYCYQFGNQKIEELEELEEIEGNQTFSKEFHTLQEMIELVSSAKIVEFLSAVRGAKKVWVNAIYFGSESKHKSVSVETFILNEGIYTELINRN